jgi:hypothetical protein
MHDDACVGDIVPLRLYFVHVLTIRRYHLAVVRPQVMERRAVRVVSFSSLHRVPIRTLVHLASGRRREMMSCMRWKGVSIQCLLVREDLPEYWYQVFTDGIGDTG